MSRLFPTTPYAEDQPFAYTTLTTHTLHRGLQSGAFIGLISGSATAFASRRRAARAAAIPTSSAIGSAQPAGVNAAAANLSKPVTQRAADVVLRHAGRGAVIGTGVLAVGLYGRMRGREEIEWQDRSWRLLRNEGQVACDDSSVGGTVVGALVSASRGLRGLPLLGAAAVGNLVGVGAYMEVWYGVLGHKME